MSSPTTAKHQPAVSQEIHLHQSQADFLRSDALLRAFVGGIGSGKSWAGSYDLIRRAKPDRLYLVVAPTYSMQSDSTFRMFLQVAEQLGVVDFKEIKAVPRLQSDCEPVPRSLPQCR